MTWRRAPRAAVVAYLLLVATQVRRDGTATVFVSRFIPGVRVAGAVMAGATQMPWRRFALANTLGAIVWASTVAGLAYLLGRSASRGRAPTPALRS